MYAAVLFFTLCRVCCLIVVLFDPVYHCDNLAGKERAGYFAFLGTGM